MPKPLPHQLPILLSPARNKVVVCGRRWGKTCLALQACVRGHGPSPGYRRGAVDGGKIWWVAPDYPTASEIWRDLKRACLPIASHKDEVERRIELPTGGSVTVKSAHDPSTLVAVGLDGLVIDEAAKVAPEAWYESLRPTLSDKAGWAMFISTPKGANWFHDLFERAGQEPTWARWQRPTADNPLIPPAELESARRDSPRYFGQEYEAQFISLEGAEWPPEYFGEHIWFDEWPPALVTRVLALDPAQGKGERSKGCYSSFVCLGVDRQAVLWADAWLSQTWDATELVAKTLELWEQLKPAGIGIEVNGGQIFLAELVMAEARRRKVVLPLYAITSHEDKEVRIRRLGPYLAQRKLRLKRCEGFVGTKVLLTQAREFPVGQYRDGPDALEMAERLLRHLLGDRPEGQSQVKVVALGNS